MELTDRQREMVDIIINKKCFKVSEIADEMHIARTTVKSHLNNIYNKYPINSIAELVYWYYTKGEA